MIYNALHYFLGNDPSKWRTDVPNYSAITLKDIYPGIDLKYSGDGTGQAAYEFIAASGADIAQIKVAYEGAESTSLDSDGKLILKTKWGDMIAAIKSRTNGVLSGIGSFSQLSEKTIGFEADGSSRQALGALVVGLVYSTYLGGGSEDWGYGIAVDGSGCAYETGWTYSSDFPMENAYDSSFNGGDCDAFVTKTSSSGNSLVYSSFLGGSGFDRSFSIAVDASGSAYVMGETSSYDFPTQNAYDASHNGGYSDVFVTKLSSLGDALLFSTFLGGSSSEWARAITVDGSGSAYVTGWTYSSNFPTENAYDASHNGDEDAFVTKFSSSGDVLLYSTFLGGSSTDYGHCIAVDGSGCVYVTGWTTSFDFPTQNAYDASYNGNGDAFVTKLSSSGNFLIYSTYLGGIDGDVGYAIAVDSSGAAHVTGRTYSSDFPTENAYDASQNGGGDVFVTKFSSAGAVLVYSTFLGGSFHDAAFGIAVDRSNCALVTGHTFSSDFPTQNAYDSSHNGDGDVFVTKFSSAGAVLLHSTYLGGETYDVGLDIVADGSGNAYVTGQTNSYNFPTLNPYQTYQGSGDAFVTKLSWTPDYLCGDANGDGSINIADVVFLINYIFTGGAAPNPLAAGDADCRGSINIADCVYLIRYIFSHGPAPCAECG